MTFSAKTQYALVSLMELAAIHDQGGVLQVGEIAQRQSIPDRYLEQMLTALRRCHIMRSLRGLECVREGTGWLSVVLRDHDGAMSRF